MNAVGLVSPCPSHQVRPGPHRTQRSPGRRAQTRAAGAVLLAALLAGCTGCASAAPQPVAVPVFPTPTAAAAAPVPRDTLLPTDCAQVLPDGLVVALLAQPVNTVASHTVLGVGSPSVGLLERLDCNYRRRSDTTTATLALRAQAYTDPDAATRHFAINVAAEGGNTHASTALAIGTAHPVLLAEAGRSVLMVTNARLNLTISLLDAVVPNLSTPDVLVDLARRVLPALAPPLPQAPDQTTRPLAPPARPSRSGAAASAARIGTHN